MILREDDGWRHVLDGCLGGLLLDLIACFDAKTPFISSSSSSTTATGGSNTVSAAQHKLSQVAILASYNSSTSSSSSSSLSSSSWTGLSNLSSMSSMLSRRTLGAVWLLLRWLLQAAILPHHPLPVVTMSLLKAKHKSKHCTIIHFSLRNYMWMYLWHSL